MNAVMKQVAETVFPSLPGAYVVWESGEERPLYVGVAKTQTLAQRWQRQHLYPRAGGSALRRSVAVYLGLVQQKLRRPDRYYPASIEAQVTDFLRSCRVELLPTQSAEEAAVLEAQLIGKLRPKLNVAGV